MKKDMMGVGHPLILRECRSTNCNLLLMGVKKKILKKIRFGVPSM